MIRLRRFISGGTKRGRGALSSFATLAAVMTLRMWQRAPPCSPDPAVHIKKIEEGVRMRG
jgi:hypothetical protein